MGSGWDLTVSGLAFRLDIDRELSVSPAFLPFLTEGAEPDFRAVILQTDRLPAVPEVLLHKDVCYRVYSDGQGGFLRFFYETPQSDAPYCVTASRGGDVRVSYLEAGSVAFSGLQNCFYHLGFEGMLIRRKRLCLHAACVETPLGGILFTGPSGIGKTTQAELWCRHRNARQINGDRPILSWDGEGWLAWGSPYAGSSRCHVNAGCPVRAIVMLSQAPECGLRRLSPREAFRGVWSGLTVQTWDREFVTAACDLAMALIADVPVYELRCTPDLRAVTCLEEVLEKENVYENPYPGPRQNADGLSVPQSRQAADSPERNL